MLNIVEKAILTIVWDEAYEDLTADYSEYKDSTTLQFVASQGAKIMECFANAYFA